MPLPSLSQLAALPTCSTRLRCITSRVGILLSDSKPTLRDVRSFRERPWTLFGSMRNRRHTIYTEGLTRTNVGNGPVWMTLTPLLGVSEVVRRFLIEKSPDRNITSMTIDDVGHYSDEEKSKDHCLIPRP